MFIVLLVLEFVVLFGAGWLVVLPVIRQSGRSASRIEKSALALTCGLVVNYASVLLLKSVMSGSVLTGILAVAGWTFFFFASGDRSLKRPTREGIVKSAVMGAVFLIYAGPVVYEPLIEWDSRSIWFFHAKLIYFAGTIGPEAGWTHPSLRWSHPDYPNLIPALAAQIAWLGGTWNEYFPKIALLPVIFASVLWIFRFYRTSLSFFLLLAAFPLFLDGWISCGNMDAHLTLFFMAALLLAGQACISRRPLDCIGSICCLMVLPYLKNEGALAIVAVLCSLPLLMMAVRLPPRGMLCGAVESVRANWRVLGLLLILALPWFLWGAIKQEADLSNDMDLFSLASMGRLLNRLSDGSWKLIVNRSFLEVRTEALLLVVMMVASFSSRKALPRECLPALFTGVIYLTGMLTIYLMTHHILIWHLDTSVERVMLAVRGCMVVATFFMLRAAEMTREPD